MRTLRIGLIWILLCQLLPPINCAAAPPLVTVISPRGWKAGAQEVLVQGANFSLASRLLLEIPGATAELKPGVMPLVNQLQFVVTIPPTATAGVFEARIAAENGISDAGLVLLDQLPTLAEIEPNNTPQQAQVITLPAAIEGRLGGVESDTFTFDGKQGQRLVVELAARRLGCNFKPVLQLFNSNRLELQAAAGSRALGGDARLVATLPADGRYYLELHDLVYRGDNNQYRLLIGDLQVAESAFPLGGRRGTTVPVRLRGGTLAAGIEVPVGLTAPEITNLLGVTLPPGPLASPLPLTLAVGDYAEVQEQPAADGTLQLVAIPGIVNGQLLQPNEQDRYRIAVTPESKLHFFVQSEQLGAPLDGVLEIRSEQGAILASQDDGPGTADPDLNFVVPAGATVLVIGLADVNGRGGEQFAYRLGIEPARGDFELTLLTPLLNVPAGGSAAVRVRATRRDFTDPIRLKVVGEVPTGLKVSGAEIATGTTETLLSLSAPADASLKAGAIRVLGEAGPVDQPTLVRPAKLAKLPVHEGLPWLQDRFAGAVTSPGLFALDVELTEPALLRGIEYTAKVKVRRTAEQTGPINLVVQTSQVVLPGQVPITPVPNLSIPENAVEGIFKITVPSNVLDAPVAIVVTGSLLDAKEKKAVVGTAESASVATRIAFPFSIQVAPIPELKRGVRNLIPAKLVRLGSFNQPVVVTLAGLPGNFRNAPITLPPGVADFQIPVLIPPAQAPGAIANLKLTGTWTIPPPLASNPLDLPLTIAVADPPAALEIFDEGNDFVAALTEGAGMAALEATDVFSGKESVLVKPDQKSRASLPGLGVAIAETPTVGQYRFIRFAWKKKTGTGVMLQLAHNGQFGAASTKGTDFRYVAGIDVLKTKAIQVAPQIPQEWTVVTRDLFADHGACTLTGIGLSPLDGEAALFDHIFLARTEADLPPPLAK